MVTKRKMDEKQGRAWLLLKLEDRLYRTGYDQEQVEEIMEYESSRDLEDIKREINEPITGQRKMNKRKLGTMAVGGFMLLGLAYAVSALYDSCADSNYSKSMQPQEQNIEQIINNPERRQ